jgi:hypothetical protein
MVTGDISPGKLTDERSRPGNAVLPPVIRSQSYAVSKVTFVPVLQASAMSDVRRELPVTDVAALRFLRLLIGFIRKYSRLNTTVADMLA